MKITDSVKIGGIEYDVKVSSLISNNVDCDGQIDYKEQLILLKSDMKADADYTKEVFLHEILHGVYEHCGFTQNEDKIRALSIALYMVIKDNPEIFK
jgi:hypothetical protein